VLDTVYVGPVPEGRHKFVFTAEPPDPEKIPSGEVVGVTVILLTCSYREQVRKTFPNPILVLRGFRNVRYGFSCCHI